MATTDPKTLLGWFEALAGRPDDAELRQRAAGWRSSEVPPPAETTLWAASLGGPGAWFLGPEDWRHWLRLLQGEPPTPRPLHDGWTAWSSTEHRLLGPSVEAYHGWPEPLASVLGTPERGNDDFLPYQAWALQDPEGRWVLLHQYLDVEGRSPDARWTRCYMDEGVDALRLAELLAIDQPEHWKPSVGCALAARFVVRRMDDHGNVFEVSRHVTRTAAQLRADQFEARGHKQTYWVE